MGLVHGGAGSGSARASHPARALVRHRTRWLLQVFKENTMSQSEEEIHQIVLRMLREGYAALTSAQQKVVDALMAVC